MDNLSAEDKNFLDQCEEEFKDRFTEQDEVFMKAFNKELSKPPILVKQTSHHNNGERRNDRHYYGRRDRPYQRPYRDNRDRGGYRSNNDYNSSFRSRYSRSNYN